MADFIGFTFKGIHSSTYHLYRTSKGDRYESGLLPNFKDDSISLTGGDGDLYEGRRFEKTDFSIEIAYDGLTEEDIRNIKKWLGGPELVEFKFDECPYKTYFVKLAEKPTFEYICFEEDDPYNEHQERREIRIYKGESSFKFIAYDPFGYTTDKTHLISAAGVDIDDQGRVNWQVSDTYFPFMTDTANEPLWNGAAQLKDQEHLSTYNYVGETAHSYVDGKLVLGIKTYNPGDCETDFQAYIHLQHGIDPTTVSPSEVSGKITFYFYKDEDIVDIMGNDPSILPDQTFQVKVDGLKATQRIWLDTRYHMLKVITPYEDTTNSQIAYTTDLRYDLVNSTDWPQIDIGEGVVKIETGLSTIWVEPLKYDYKYY